MKSLGYKSLSQDFLGHIKKYLQTLVIKDTNDEKVVKLLFKKNLRLIKIVNNCLKSFTV